MANNGKLGGISVFRVTFNSLAKGISSTHTLSAKGFSDEILALLHHCKKTRSPVTVALIKQWLADVEEERL